MIAARRIEKPTIRGPKQERRLRRSIQDFADYLRVASRMKELSGADEICQRLADDLEKILRKK